MELVVLYPPSMAAMGQAIASSLPSSTTAHCIAELSTSVSEASLGVAWEVFDSGNPNLKLRADFLIGKHVVLLLSQDDQSSIFAQLSVLLFIQRFVVPDALASSAKDKWKGVVDAGTFTLQSAAAISVVIPWYRYCQMERTSRWAVQADLGKWTNTEAHGPFVDVPTAHTFAALLSAPPPPAPGGRPAPPLPPKQLLLLDLHETKEVEDTVRATRAWANAVAPYDFVHGSGTYFASALDHFLAHHLPDELRDVSNVFVVFPDSGAYRRFKQMAIKRLAGIAEDHVLYIAKTRVIAEVRQTESLFYRPDGDLSTDPSVREALPSGAHVLIVDDFTNSGSTLFGGATILKKKAEGAVKVSAWVSHFVAKYDRPTVHKFVDKLYGGPDSLDFFYCTDSNPTVVGWLTEELAARDGPTRASVMPLGPLIAEWVAAHPLKPSASADYDVAMDQAVDVAAGGCCSVQ